MIDVAVHGSVGPIVRSLDFDAANMRVLTSTLAAEVFELSARDGTNCMVGGGPMLQGHAHSDLDCELHGLAPHPTSARCDADGYTLGLYLFLVLFIFIGL